MTNGCHFEGAFSATEKPLFSGRRVEDSGQEEVLKRAFARGSTVEGLSYIFSKCCEVRGTGCVLRVASSKLLQVDCCLSSEALAKEGCFQVCCHFE